MTQSEILFFFFVMLHVYILKCPSLELPFIFFISSEGSIVQKRCQTLYLLAGVYFILILTGNVDR